MIEALDVRSYADLKPLTIDQRYELYQDRFSHWPQEKECERFIVILPDLTEFIEEYGHFTLSEITATVEDLMTCELTDIEYFTFKEFFLEETSRDVDLVEEFGIEQIFRSDEIKVSWETSGTWLEPPLLCDASLVRPNRSGLQLIEGHTRIGCLNGLARKPLIKIAKYHKCLIIR